MSRVADLLKNYEGSNPFRDSQPRNFADKKILGEFYPVSSFWSLFNDQHEVLLGARGSGKTFLLKTMRYSMLKKVDDFRAKALIEKKEFLAVYVPMHLERVSTFSSSDISDQEQVKRFQVFFNCALAQALIDELISIIEDIPELSKRAQCMFNLAYGLNRVWFNEENQKMDDLKGLSSKIDQMFYNINWENRDKIPPIFCGPICTSLIAVKKLISQTFVWEEEPTWIICIDEAEFLAENLQQCINTVFRSDSNRIALKVATLPFFHKTLKTLDDSVRVVDGNDFSYRVVDLDYQDRDFVDLTNKLVKHRIESRIDLNIKCDSLETFLGTEGKDDLIDYFRLEMGEAYAQKAAIKNGIINSFSEERKKNAPNYRNQQKAIFDKYAHEYYVREVRKRDVGNHKPGWFAGARVIRKVSQGNPRMFIQLMNALCEAARKQQLTPSIQHEVVYQFANDYCEATKALDDMGPVLYKNLNAIGECIEQKVHKGPISTYGTSFTIKKLGLESTDRKWIQVAIAYSRLIVDDETKKSGIRDNTKFTLANIYAVKYWIPMRNDTSLNISLKNNDSNSYLVETEKDILDQYQLSLDFEELK